MKFSMTLACLVASGLAAEEEDCFFDSVSAAALSLLQKSATFVGGAHGGPVAVAASLPAAPLLTSIVVPLRRVKARQASGFMAPRVKDVHFHVGHVTVGHPAQHFEVVFDTSSIFSWLHHEACRSPACQAHAKFSPSKSSTAVDVFHNGTALSEDERLITSGSYDEVVTRYTQADLGEGDLRARFLRDQLCLGRASEGAACLELSLAAAVEADEAPFRALPADGIVGLSLGAEAFGISPMTSFLGRLFANAGNVPPQFGIWLGKDGGEIHLGGHELADLASPLQWFPVHRPEDGYWQVSIRTVRAGGAVVNDCAGGCHGIVDTGVSHLGVQAGLLPAVREALATRFVGGSCTGPDLAFDLGDMVIVLSAAEYADKDCVPELGSLDLDEPQFNGIFTFGASVLQRYYAAFDWEQKKVGFAAASQSPIPAGQDVVRSMRGAVIV